MADSRKSASVRTSAKAGLAGLAPPRKARQLSTLRQGDVTLTDKAYAQIEEQIVTLQ
jgi:hypothetical protein